MKKKTLLAVALSGALAVGAFAYGMNNQQGMMCGQQNMQKARGMGMMRQNMMGNQNIHMMSRHGMMGARGMHTMHRGKRMFSQLNLTSEQRYQLSILRDEMRLEMKKQMHNMQPMRHIGTFFKGDNFDKDAFKNQMEKRHEKMLNLRADNMEKAFKILTKEQIAQFKANMK